MFDHLLNIVAITNAYILYNEQANKKMKINEFYKKIILDMVETNEIVESDNDLSDESDNSMTVIKNTYYEKNKNIIIYKNKKNLDANMAKKLPELSQPRSQLKWQLIAQGASFNPICASSIVIKCIKLV